MRPEGDTMKSGLGGCGRRRSALVGGVVAGRPGAGRGVGRARSVTVRVPGIVDLFDLYEPAFRPGARAQAIYRLESGYAHAKQWTLALGAQRVTPRDPSGRSLAIVQGLEDL